MRLYKLKNLPAHIQLAEKMRGRGQMVDAGSRLEYLVANMSDNFKALKSNLGEKLEDPSYQQLYGNILKIDYLHYLKLAANPLDQALSVAYPDKLPNFMDTQYKLRVKKVELLNQIKKYCKPQINFINN